MVHKVVVNSGELVPMYPQGVGVQIPAWRYDSKANGSMLQNYTDEGSPRENG
jgi:hypothetical protein